MVDKLCHRTYCSGCSNCAQVCPVRAISMVEDNLGFWYPQINESVCINCGLCFKSCPVNREYLLPGMPCLYAAYDKDESNRRLSSSGGIFYKIAHSGQFDNIWGARFNNQFMVEHDYVKKGEDCRIFSGSKYVQSKISNAYTIIGQQLQSGEKVLFTGTGCQVAGLLSYLETRKIPREHLVTMDIICHGVPAPAMWSAYLESLQKKYGGVAAQVNFRNKDAGWKNYALVIQFAHGGAAGNTPATKDRKSSKEKIGYQYKRIFREDLYMQGFLQDLFLRESCYHCHFKGIHRKSDLTIGDFLRIEQSIDNKEFDNGVSMVLVNTDYGKRIWESVQNDMIFLPLHPVYVQKHNRFALESARQPEQRHLFEKAQTSNEMICLLRKSTNRGIFHQIKQMFPNGLIKVVKSI